MVLPTEPVISKQVNPRKLLIYAFPKCGKTTAFAGLPNNLIIDIEDGSGYIDGMVINVLAEASKILNIPSGQVMRHPEGYSTILTVLRDVITSIKAANEKKGSPVYDHITLDSLSGLIPIATYLASEMYKKTVIGKNYTGNDVVMDLPQGGGYQHLWSAFDAIMGSFEGVSKEGLHFICHVKDSSVLKDGKDLTARDLMLPGEHFARICLIGGISLESICYNTKVETILTV